MIGIREVFLVAGAICLAAAGAAAVHFRADRQRAAAAAVHFRADRQRAAAAAAPAIEPALACGGHPQPAAPTPAG